MTKKAPYPTTEIEKIRSIERVYDGWSTVDEVVADLRRRNGDIFTVRYEVRDHGRGAAVLPYDPDAGTVLLVRQLRLPVHLSGDDGTMLEVCAGLIDETDPDPARTVVREAHEETGYRVFDLELVSAAYSSPGSITEKLWLYLAQYRRGTAESHDLADEHEDIEVVEMTAAGLLAMVGRGEIRDLKTFALALALKEKRPGLFPGR